MFYFHFKSVYISIFFCIFFLFSFSLTDRFLLFKYLISKLNFYFLLLQEDLEKCDAFVVVYSVVDKASFTHAEQLITSFQDMDLIRTRPVILVANKIDLARSRAVSSQGNLFLYYIMFSKQRQ